MKITNVTVRKNTQGRMLGLASIVIEDCFVVNDIRIIKGDDHIFVAMPSRKLEDGTFKDTCHPINKEVRSKIENVIISAYNEL